MKAQRPLLRRLVLNRKTSCYLWSFPEECATSTMSEPEPRFLEYVHVELEFAASHMSSRPLPIARRPIVMLQK